MVCAPSPNFAPAIKGKTPPLFAGVFFIQPIHNILKIDTTMNVKIQLSDEAYKTLGEFYQFNLSSCIRQQNSLTAQFVSFSLSNLANIFYPPQFLQ